MKWSDIKQIGVWTAATSVVVIGAVGLGQSVAQIPNGARTNGQVPETTIGSVVLSARVVPGLVAYGEKTTIWVTALNKGKAKASVDGSLFVVRTEFKGNPMSRVLRPSDTVRTKVHTVPLAMKLNARESKTLTFTYVPRAETPSPKVEGEPVKVIGGNVSYAVVLETKEGERQLMAFRVVPRRDLR